MAIIHPYFLNYLCTVLRNFTTQPMNIYNDPIVELTESYCVSNTQQTSNIMNPNPHLNRDVIEIARMNYLKIGIVGVIQAFFGERIIDQFTEPAVERKVIVFKNGYKALPATKASIIMRGFGYNLTDVQILSIYASYGLVRSLKDLVNQYDFMDINRRVQRLSKIVEACDKSVIETEKIQKRYNALRTYIQSSKKEKQKVIESSGIKRRVFFYYLKNFNKYGVLGIIDKSEGLFRNSKVGIENEAQMVMDKIQNPNRQKSFYVERLKYKGIEIDPSSISKIFTRWEVEKFKSAFVSDLEKFENFADEEHESVQVKNMEITQTQENHRLVDTNFIQLLKGISKTGIRIDAPGLLVLWVYVEELGIHDMLSEINLTLDVNGYNWFDHFLFNIGRVFYGIPTYNRACNHEDPSLSFFSHLVKLPGIVSFLAGLKSIDQKKVFRLQTLLLKKIKELGLVDGKRVAFDFHQIDLDVIFSKLRQFGKGPSPKKKICYNGFRPHIAWDLNTGNLIVAEYRKASARGTSTIKRFVKDFMMSIFKDSFEEVYIDSEYTGKDVWNFILDIKNGMGAQLTACLKQNKFVKSHRDKFLLKHQGDDNFWCYWDEKHVYSSKTFQLQWEYICPHDKKKIQFKITCVVKKNIENGKLRCFGTSKLNQTSIQILKDYSDRWIIENGIKDLIASFFIDKCPGTDPHLVNVHFFVISICKHIYRMIQRDAEHFIKNRDGTIKSLDTMRASLIRQGNSKVKVVDDTIEVHFLNSFSPELTASLNKFYQSIHKKTSNGLKILGGLKLKFLLLPPYGEDHKNAFKKTPLCQSDIF